MASYLEKRSKVREKLKIKGDAATFTKSTTGNYVPGSGLTSGTSISVTGYGILTSFNVYEKKNTAIKDGDSKFIFAPDENQQEVEPGMEINWFGDVFNVVSPNPVKLTGDVIVYNIHLSLK